MTPTDACIILLHSGFPRLPPPETHTHTLTGMQRKRESFSSKKETRVLRPQKPLKLIRDGEVGGSGIFISSIYSLHCHHQNDSALRWEVVSHFKVSLIVWAKSQDSVLKPQSLKSKESRSGSNRGSSVYQPIRKHGALRLQKPLRPLWDF